MKLRTTALAVALMGAASRVFRRPGTPRPSVDGMAAEDGMAVEDGTAVAGVVGGREPEWALPLERS